MMRIKLVFAVLLALFVHGVAALDAPIVTATAKGPNQINLTWAAVANPGYGYKVEILSAGDARYSSWTDYTATLRNNFGYLPYWVTEGHYLDRADGTGTTTGTCNAASSACGTASQLSVFGLKYGTAYSFRVRTYAKNDAGTETYSSYSATASTTTTTPSVIRHVKQGGTGNGTSEAAAWGSLSSASGVTAGTLVIVHGGTLSAASLSPSNSGTQASRIVFQADPGETVILTAPSSRLIGLTTDYVVVDGFTLQDPSGTSDNVIYVSGNRNVIANTTLDGPAPSATGYSPWVMGNYNVFENNHWKEYGAMDGTSGGPLGVFGDYNVISNVRHEKGGHDTLIVRGKRNAIVNSLLGEGWGMGIEIQGTGGYIAQYNLLEGCVVPDVAKAGSPYAAEYKPGIEISGDHNTVRRNVLRTGRDHGIEISPVLQSANYNLVYNNVVYKFDQGGIWYMSGAIDHTTLANNIVYYNAESFTYGCSRIQFMLRDTRTGSVHRNNMIMARWSGVDQPTASIIWDEPASTCRSLAQQQAYAPSEWFSNVTSPPSFIDEASYDFHLKSISALRGVGYAVTDTYWGSTGETDLGAFKYFDQATPAPTVSALTCTSTTLQAPGTTTCTATASNATSYAWAFNSCGTPARCSTPDTSASATVSCGFGGPCTPCVTASGPGGTSSQYCTATDYLTVRYVKPSGFGAN